MLARNSAGCDVGADPSVARRPTYAPLLRREQVHVAFDVDDRDEVVADHLRAADLALGKAILLPHRRAGAAVERLHRTLVVGDVDVLAVAGEPIQARHVARPVERAARDVEARDASLVRDRAHLLAVDQRQRRDVGDALELGRALRIGDGRVPADDAGVDVERQQAAARGADEEAAARADAPPAKLRTVSAGAMRWLTHFFAPSAALSACTLPSPANTATTPSPTRGGAITSVETRAVHFGLPSASNASTSPLSVPTTTIVASAPTPAESALAGGDAPDLAAVRRVDARDGAVGRRGVDRIVGNDRREARDRLADRRLPVDRRRGRRLELRQRAGLLACSTASATRTRAAPAGSRRSFCAVPQPDSATSGERERRARAAGRAERRCARSARVIVLGGPGAVVFGAGAARRPARRRQVPQARRCRRGGRGRGRRSRGASAPPSASSFTCTYCLYCDLASSLASAVW